MVEKAQFLMNCVLILTNWPKWFEDALHGREGTIVRETPLEDIEALEEGETLDVKYTIDGEPLGTVTVAAVVSDHPADEGCFLELRGWMLDDSVAGVM